MKRKSDQSRIIDLGFKAESRTEIMAIVETLRSIADNRFPVERATKKPRKPRTPKATPAEATKPNDDAGEAVVSSVNKKKDNPRTAPKATRSEDAAWVEEPVAAATAQG